MISAEIVQRVGRVAAVDDLLEEYRRATMFFDAGDPNRAARLLEPIVEAEPNQSNVRLLLARAYFHSAQLTRAEEQLRILLEHDPSDHYVRFVLGRTLERQSRPAEALPHLRMAAAMHPSEEYAETLRRVAAKA
jgi:cytochrome c-type biogenesis protein CcmH/NrfG